MNFLKKIITNCTKSQKTVTSKKSITDSVYCLNAVPCIANIWWVPSLGSIELQLKNTGKLFFFF